MIKVITYGTYDLLHHGHRRLLERAKALGDYLIVGVTSDDYDRTRGKINASQSLMERIEAVKALGIANEIIVEEYEGQKIDDIRRLGVDIFTVGSDWEGYFDYLKEYCEVVYLPRTEGISSTQLREERPSVKVGIIGTGSIARRFVPESKVVNSIEIAAAYNPNFEHGAAFCQANEISLAARTQEELFAACDAVYVASPHYTHYEYVKAALEAGKHVLCETPFVFHTAEAEELFRLADEKKLVLMLAHKTAYCPAFGHLVSLLKSGAIGEIVDVNASVTTLTDEQSEKMDSTRFGGSMSENACFPLLPIFKLLGTDYRDVTFYSKMGKGVDLYTKAVFRYDKAIASFQVGLGAKTEGSMTISGTKGYAYVPAPWWKTDYFEIRFEDQNLNKKYFYPFAGEGLRYEIKDFVTSILQGTYPKLSRKELLTMTDVQDRYLNKEGVYFL